VLLGPSGCGRDTCSGCSAGWSSQPRQILIGERVVNHLPRARQIAMVFQSYALYRTPGVEATSPFRSRRPRSRRMRQRRKIDWAAGNSGDRPTARCKPRQLSGGQRRGLARALVREPNVFLLMSRSTRCPASRIGAGRVAAVPAEIGTTTIYVTRESGRSDGNGASDRGDRWRADPSGPAPARDLREPADTFVTIPRSPP